MATTELEPSASEALSPPGLSASRVLGNSAILSAYYVLDSALLFLTTLLLARYLGVSDFGKLSFALAYGLVLYVLTDPGISLTLTKLVARDRRPSNQGIANGFTLRLLLVGAGCLVGLIPLPFSAYLWTNALVLVPVIWSEQIRGLTLTYCACFRGFHIAPPSSLHSTRSSKSPTRCRRSSRAAPAP